MSTQKKTDCPLCEAKEVIIYTEPEMVTHPGPDRRKIGGYTRNLEGGGYDLSHAKECPKLKGAIDKESLLAFHVNAPYVLKADFFDFEDYQTALEEIGCSISVDIFRRRARLGKEREWYVTARVVGSMGKFLKTESDTPDKAFELLRHRLLCGEVFGTWQYAGQQGELRFVEIQK